MTTEITDQWLGTRVIGDKPSDLIKDQLKVLMAMKNDGRVPSKHLLFDIEVYKYILNQKNQDAKAAEYFSMKSKISKQKEQWAVSKREVCTRLGWVIPEGD